MCVNRLELANKEDAEVCYEIIDAGRRFQREQGFVQWTDDYPNQDTIYKDILNKKGFVIKVDDRIAGYMCIDFDGEPVYDDIEGKWQSENSYAVIHRMAFSEKYRGRGLADIAWCLIEDFCKKNNVYYIRVDTDPSNKRMQHILEKNGFKPCGVIYYQGRPRLAYDKKCKK